MSSTLSKLTINQVVPGFGAGNWKGSIDEFRIYNRSLSATEVADLYQLGSYHISDWSVWTSEQAVASGVGIQNSTAKTKFYQFRANLFTKR